MSFPNPDNYARDCDCGTAGANTTPPPATIQAEINSLGTRVTALEETNDVIVSSGGIANLTTAQQALIREGSIVVTTDGRRWVYSGAGSKVLQASYIELSSPFTFRTLFATTTPSISPDTKYFSTIDAVGATNAIELRNFKLPYTCRIVGCSATLYNASGATLASVGTIQYRLATKANEASTSPTTTYGLLTLGPLTIAVTGMTSNYSTSSNVLIPAGTNLAMEIVFTSLIGVALRGELTLYLVNT